MTRLVDLACQAPLVLVTCLPHCILVPSNFFPPYLNSASTSPPFVYSHHNFDQHVSMGPKLSKGGTVALKTTSSSLKYPLLSLPAECRLEIFRAIFAEVKLKLKLGRRAKTYQGGLHANKLGLLSLFNKDTRKELAILFTSRPVLDEAIDELAKATTLKIDDIFVRDDPLALLPTWFIRSVPKLEIDYEAFVHIDRNKLCSLREVTLVKEGEGINNGADDGVHLLTCKVCGGDDSHHYIDSVMAGAHSWKWFRNQFVCLSKENGWKAHLSARIEYSMLVSDNVYIVSRHSYSLSLTDIPNRKLSSTSKPGNRSASKASGKEKSSTSTAGLSNTGSPMTANMISVMVRMEQ